MSSDTYALLLGLALIGYTAAVASINRIITTAIVLHNGAWAVALIIVGSGVLHYRPLSTTAWLIITSAIVAFNLGATAAVTANRGAGRPAPLQLSLVPLWAYWAVLALFSVGFIVYLSTIAKLFGLGTLLTDPVAIRGDTETSYLASFPLYGKLLFYLGPLAFVLTLFPRLVDGLHRTPLIFRLAVLGFLTVAQLALLQRTNVFTSALWALGVYFVGHCHRDRRLGAAFRWRQVVLTAVLCAVAFQVVAVGLGKTGDNDPVIRYSVSPAIRDSGVTEILHYTASGIPSFGLLVDSDNPAWPPPDNLKPLFGDYNPQTWGVATFSAPAKVIPGLRRWPDISPFVRLPASTNVYTWLEPWYRDFRAPGAVLGSLVVGLVVGWVVRTRSDPAIGLLLAGFLAGMTTFAAFTNRFSSVLGVSSLLALAALSLVVRASARSRRRDAPPLAEPLGAGPGGGPA